MRLVGWFAYYFAQVVTNLLGAALWRMKVVGKGNIPKSGAFLLCPVHRSNIDGPLTCTFTPRRMNYLAKKELFNIAVFAKLFHHMGAIPVNRDSPGRESLKICLDALQNGKPLVLFPEGGRRSGPVVAEVMEGAAYLALKADVPVVPVGIDGSEAAQPLGSKMLRPSKVTVVIGKPFRLKPGERSAASRTAMREGTEEIRTHLQTVFDEAMGYSAVDDK